MFGVGVTVPMVFENCTTTEGIDRAAQAGADGVEFFDWESEDLEALTRAAEESDIELFGTLAAGAGSNIDDHESAALVRPTSHDVAVSDIERSLEAAATLSCSTLIVTVGPEQPDLDHRTQREAIIDALRTVAPTAERLDVTIVVEPLNVAIDHPGYFLTTSSEGAEIIEAVDSPNVKLLFDVYHQQITEGNIIQTLREYIDSVGHVHIADVPGRHEPNTGELNYRNILQALAESEYEGNVSTEFAPTGDPVAAVRSVVDMVENC